MITLISPTEARTRLERLREQLRSDIDQEAESVAEFGREQADEFVSQHPADLGTSLFLQESALNAEEILLAELRQVDGAIDRLDRGAYGSCVDCGAAIDPQRLELRPHAVRCLECETRAELAIRHHRPHRRRY